MLRKLRTSLGHALIVLGTILGLLAILGYGILRNEGYVALGILLFGTLHLLCGTLLLARSQNDQRLKWAALAVACLSFLVLLAQSIWYLAGASIESTALQLIACFIAGLSVYAVLNTIMHETSAMYESSE
ncbi:MAG: hypothetical protein AAF708_11280 [Deinococcota bacterium]